MTTMRFSRLVSPWGSMTMVLDQLSVLNRREVVAWR